MTGKKNIPRLIREKALAIHRRHCDDGSCGGEPTPEDWKQARREVMPSESERKGKTP